VVGPVGCGEKRSLAFVVFCGALWWIVGFIGIVAGFLRYSPGFAERIFAGKRGEIVERLW
jgi:hypothetical protein